MSSGASPYWFRARVGFGDTDAMGIVHHSAYVHWMEDARTAWLEELGIMHFHVPVGTMAFAVHEMCLKYLSPLRFPDHLWVAVDGEWRGLRLILRYAIFGCPARGLSRGDEASASHPARLCTTAMTTLIPVGLPELQPLRVKGELLDGLRGVQPTAVWPPSDGPWLSK